MQDDERRAVRLGRLEPRAHGGAVLRAQLELLDRDSVRSRRVLDLGIAEAARERVSHGQ